jgi:glycosyltransferase involved in cell wall biosynthesis
MAGNELELSVIIPTYNRGVVLEKCLEALSCQTLSKDVFEVIVSDDGSDGAVRDRIEPFLRKNFTHSLYLWQVNSGQSAARNHAILESRGRILLFINDDTIATPNVLKEHKRTHKQYLAESDAVLGRVTISPELPASIFAKLHLDYFYDLWEGQTELDWRAFYTCNISVKKSFLIKFGFFEEKLRYHDDVELGERLSHHGLRVIYNPKALGYHDHFLTEKDFLRYAKFSSQALVAWYKKAPHLKNRLVSLGLYIGAPLPERIKYLIDDLLINELTIPFLISLARYFSKKQEGIALRIYSKIFLSLSRKTIRKEMYNKGN